MVSVDRISSDRIRINETYTSRKEAVNQIIARKTSENKRYLELYGADCADLTHFNLIIDTSFLRPEQVAELILIDYKKWQTATNHVRAYISPLNLFPTRTLSEF
jgi:cytidylate kinase